MPIAFGVHIGHTSMCVAAEKDGNVDVIANDAGDRVTPAVVGMNEGEILVGLSAKQLSARKPESIAQDTISKIAQDDKEVFALHDNGNTKQLSTEKVHSKLYKYMKDVALTYSTENDFSKTVITVPLSFTPDQRKQVKNYATLGGLHVTQVISEPAAALLAYGISQNDQTESNTCLVFKCGGASLTATVMQTSGGMFSVLGSVTKEVGGDLVTNILIEMLAAEFKRKYKMDPRESKRGKMKLKINAENAKHVLSTLDNANCYIESLYEGIDFNSNVSRSRLDAEFSKILSKFIDPLHEVLDTVKIKPTDIDKVVLCGGTAKIPKLQKSLKDLFVNAELLNTINPDEVVAVGAATQASLLTQDDFIEDSNITVHGLNYDVVFLASGHQEGPQDSEKVPSVLIPKKCPIPVRRSHHFIMGGDKDILTVKVFLRSGEKLMELTELTLRELEAEKEMKPSLSAHIHRDGGIHIALTEKVSNKCDQVTFPAPNK